LYFGASDRLLNADHDKVYFDGMPIYKGRVWTCISSRLYIYLVSVSYLILLHKLCGYVTAWLSSICYSLS